MIGAATRKWPWLVPLLFVISALLLAQFVSMRSSPSQASRYFTVLQAVGCAAFAALGTHRLIQRWHVYQQASREGNHVQLTNFELLIGFILLTLGEAAHNVVTVSAFMHNETVTTWPYAAVSFARAIEVAGIVFCVRAICVRQFSSECQWLFATAGMLVVGKIVSRGT